MLKEIKNIFSFLTIIPASMDENMLTDAAKLMFVFPLVGALIGLIGGIFGWAISQFLPSLVAGGLVLGALLLITGLHHTDGLLDFGDGLMAHGTPERKIEIMHDHLTGAGGLCLGILTLLITALSVGELGSNLILQGLVVAEVSAKLAMVVGAWAGKPAHQGMASAFLESMHGEKGSVRLIIALAISLGIAVPLLWIKGVIVVFTAVLTSLIIVFLSHRHFRGVTGDVLGATNELARLVSLIALLSVVGWP
jgi:adenosylcobinamide-GDP ribazoletransferase